MRRVLVQLAAVTLLVTSCSAQGGVVVTMDEYVLTAKPASEKAGTVTFTAKNLGAIAHQLLVLRTQLRPDKLPVKGGVVRLDVKGVELVEEIPIVAAGDSEPLSLDLTPGDYTLICNIAGHYSNGMHTRFRVS
jgi:uncharacterized cupredoxin-like copper-binding protein